MPKPTDPTTKTRALMLARNLGAEEASKLTGVRAGTIRVWMSRSGEIDVMHEERRHHVEGTRLSLEQRRQSLADTLMNLAKGFAEAIVVPEPQSIANLDDIKVLAVALGITVDKVQRVMGDAVSEDSVIEIDLGSVRRPEPSKGTAAAG